MAQNNPAPKLLQTDEARGGTLVGTSWRWSFQLSSWAWESAADDAACTHLIQHMLDVEVRTQFMS